MENLKALRYYLAFCATVIVFFVYSSLTGWKWFNPTETESERPTGRHPGTYHYRYYYHK